MKNKTLATLLISLVLLGQSFAQQKRAIIEQEPLVLTNETHGLRAGDLHITQTADYEDEGKSGKDILWDFSSLYCNGQKMSELVGEDNFSFADVNPQSNVAVLDEQDRSFVFDVNNDHIQYTGLKTPSSLIVYDKPVVKMQYPFSYGSSFKSDFSGEGFYNNGQTTVVTGTVSAKGDSYGTLILPNEIFNNTLKVVTKTTTQERNMCGLTETETTKHLWYTEGIRYPVLVLMKTKLRYANGEEKISKTAYYTEKVFATKNKSANIADVQNILNKEHNINLYPNPFAEQLNINYELAYDCNAQIELFDAAGTKISTLENGNKSAGNYQLNLSQGKQKMVTGTYFIRFTFGEKIYVQKVICEE